MKLADVPKAAAYLVFHDAFDNGAMDVYPQSTLAVAEEKAALANAELDAMGYDSGVWRAYTKLPRKRIFKFHTPIEVRI